MNKVVKLSLALFLIVILTACQTYVRAIKKQTDFEHVLKIPSNAYGPGMILAYTRKSGFTRGCWAWELANIEESEYSTLIRERTISSANTYTFQESNLSFDISIKEKDLGSLSAEYKNVSEVQIALSNGKQYDYLGHPSEALSEIEPNSVYYNDLKYLYEGYGRRVKFYFVMQAYAYDYEYKVNVDGEWKIAAELPEELIDIISAEIGFSGVKQEINGIAGKGLFIGFNGPRYRLDSSETDFQRMDRKTTEYASKDNHQIDILCIIDVTNEVLDLIYSG